MAGKQRRGKSEKAPQEDTSVEAQISKARAAVEKSRFQAATLHSQWRLHLLRLNYMVILVTMHQWQAPMVNCLKDVKSFNKSQEADQKQLSGFDAMYYILNDTLCESLGVIMGVLLTLCLNQFYQDSLEVIASPETVINKESFFTNKYYMVATGLVPAIINFYYHRTQHSTTCLDHPSFDMDLSNVIWERDENADSLSSKARGFPVVVVYHMIATGCCWFMDFQQSQQNRNIQLIEKMKRDLIMARAENKESKNADKKGGNKQKAN